MSTESMVTQADFEAIMDRLEKSPMNLTGKRWRDTPDDPALVELREHFILPIIEEYVRRHRTAAQPEREAVLEIRAAVFEAVKAHHAAPALLRRAMLDDTLTEATSRILAALTTPAPAAQPEREADLSEIRRAWNDRDGWKRRALRAEAALTTPAPAVSTDEIVAAGKQLDREADRLSRSTIAVNPMMRDILRTMRDAHAILTRLGAEQ